MEMHTLVKKKFSGSQTKFHFDCLDVACEIKPDKIEGDEETDEHTAAYATLPDCSCIQNSE
jgi:hypothetical protein